MTPAGKLQAYLRKQVEALGGQYRKAKWEGRVSCPDCYIWLTEGRYAWVEVKAGADRLSAVQIAELQAMRKGGLWVFTVRSEAEIDAVLSDLRAAEAYLL